MQDRKIIQNAAVEAMKYQREITYSEEADILAKLKDYGMEINHLPSEELKAFKDRVSPIYKKMRAKIGDKIIDICLKEIERFSDLRH